MATTKFEEDQDIVRQLKFFKDQKKNAATHFGVVGEPIFNFEWTQILPCMLHVLMACTRKLLELLISEATTLKLLTLKRLKCDVL